MDKLNINNEMSHLDRKDRSFYDSLTDEEKKKFSTYLMVRWSSCVQGDSELQEYYVQSCNHYLNKNFFAISRHPKLQWLCATALSPGLGTHRHQWIAPKKKETVNDVKKILLKLYPNAKLDDVELLSSVIDKKQVKQLLHEHGHNKD